jgi:hypothetical protein
MSYWLFELSLCWVFFIKKGFETFNHQEELSPATLWQPLQEEIASNT